MDALIWLVTSGARDSDSSSGSARERCIFLFFLRREERL